MSEQYDKTYRLLFSHPKLVANLIQRFVGGDWVRRLDFGTLEKVSERDLSPQLVRREKDLLWRLRIKPGGVGGQGGAWFYVFIHLEFQSEPDLFMALRMVTYKVLFYEDLVRRGALTERGTLPPLLSLVLYNGSRPWKAARSLEQLVEPLPGYEGMPKPEGFSLLDYRLIEERAYSLSELDRDPDPVSMLFRLEKSRDLEELRQGVQQLAKTIPGAEDDRLREAFATWLTTVLIPSMEPGGEISEIRDLTEVDSMLQQSVIEWRDGWFEDGWKKGLQEGRQEGRQEGEAVLFLRLVEKKFGVVSEDFRAKIESARSEQLLEWTDRILTARRLDQVFED